MIRLNGIPLSRSAGRLGLLAGSAAATTIALAALANAFVEKPSRQSRADEGDGTPPKAAERLREGTKLVEVEGYFKPTGDRITFYLNSDDRRLQVLENLNLERISALIGDTPDPLEWTISGIITEFGGSNFLLIQHAELKSRSDALNER